MSKYIKRIPLERIGRVAVAVGGGRTLAGVKAATGADLIVNGGFFSAAGKATHHLKADGVVLAREQWGQWGYAWDSGGDIRMEALPAEGRRSYVGAYELLSPMVGIGDRLSYGAELGGKRGRTAMGLTGTELLLYCSGDGTADAATPEDLRDELYKLGAESAVMLDGGGSSQCDLGGAVIQSARKVHNYICVWLKKEEEKPMGKTYTVCLDPGHGVETPGKRSPDGSYLEHEFTLDMARRMKGILERHGVKVTLTRASEHCPTGASDNGDLARRVQTANNIAGLDLFVSLHSNAAGNGSQWMNARGYEVYTSAPGAAAGRNIAAGKILARAKEAGINVRSAAPKHESYYVCIHTMAPALLIEHLFHDNRDDVALLKSDAYRAKLAEANCRGILDYLGIQWVEETEASDPGASAWAAEAWRKAAEKGVFDGTKPQGALTREQAAVVLERLGLI